MRPGRAVLTVLCCALIAPAPAHSASPAAAVDEFGDQRAREFVLTDIGNEPDDQMSLVRQLLYSNEIDLEGVVATTSTWKRNLDEGSTAGWDQVVGGYEQVHASLLKHDPNYPSAQHLRSIFHLGQEGYGLEAMGEGKPVSAGSRAIIAAVDKPDVRPMWVTAWGGTNTLAQALWHVRKTRSAAELAAFVSKLRVYTISDQDDAGIWMRKEFPQLFYVVSPSGQPGSYAQATWTGISGEHFNRPSTIGRGPDPTLVSHGWLARHIQSKGPLGEAYPTYMFIMEGDTPSWFWLVRNGLAGDRNPSWGGWGGRYLYRERKEGPTAEPRPIFTNGSCAPQFSPDADCTNDARSADTVIGFDRLPHTDDFATIYRWRDAYQFDFSNRMDWTIREFADANHAPDPVINGVGGRAPLYVTVKPNTPVKLDAAGSTDPDGDSLTFSWLHYKEAGRTVSAESPEVELTATSGQSITVTSKGVGQAHVILTATDNGGTPAGDPFPARTYRRIVLNVTNEATQPPAPAPPGAAADCQGARLSLQRAGQRRGRRAVALRGRRYVYRLRLTCHTGGPRRPAPKGTVVYLQWPKRNGKLATRPTTIRGGGTARIRLRLYRTGTVRAIYISRDGKRTTGRLNVRVRARRNR